MNVDTIYDGETTYNNIISSPVSVYVYIPTNVSTFYSGKLQFWFEHEDGSGNKYNCGLSNNGTVSGVNSNTTVSGFTILCQFTMTSNNIVFNITMLVITILFIYLLKLFKLII